MSSERVEDLTMSMPVATCTSSNIWGALVPFSAGLSLSLGLSPSTGLLLSLPLLLAAISVASAAHMTVCAQGCPLTIRSVKPALPGVTTVDKRLPRTQMPKFESVLSNRSCHRSLWSGEGRRAHKYFCASVPVTLFSCMAWFKP